MATALLKLRRESVLPGDLTTPLGQGEPYIYSPHESFYIGTDGIGGYRQLVSLDVINSGSIKVSGDIQGTNGNFSGNISVTGNITIGGNIILGDEIVDEIIVNASLSGSLIPSDNALFDIGSTTKYYSKLYVNEVVSPNITATYVEYVNVGNKPSLVSGSIQVVHDDTNGFVANEHVDHSTLSVTAGIGLSGGGNLLSTKSIALDTTSSHFTDGVLAKLNSENVISGSSQLDGTTINNLTLTNASASGSFNGIFYGDGTNLTGVTSYTDSDTLAYINSQNVLSGSKTDITELNAFTSSIQTEVDGLSAATSSYLLNTTDTLDGDLTVTGILTAQEFHTEFISSSIIYESGSTKFGDSPDDIHARTGSFEIDGTLSISTTTLVTNLNADLLDGEEGSYYLDYNNSTNKPFIPTLNAGIVSGSSQLDGTTIDNLTLTNTTASGSFSGSFQGDGSQLTGTATGFNASEIYKFNNSVAGTDPGNGLLSFNNANPASVTEIYVDYLADSGLNTTTYLSNIKAGDIIYVQEAKNSSNFLHGTVTSIPVDETGFYSIPLTVTNFGSLPTVNRDIGLTIEYLPETATPPDLSGLLLNTTDTLTGDLTVTNKVISQEVQITSGSITYSENIDIDTGTEVVSLINSANYDGVFFDYTVKRGANVRIGTVMAIHDELGAVAYTDISTLDIGDTTTLVFSVDILTGNMRLLATTSTDNWIVKCFNRAL